MQGVKFVLILGFDYSNPTEYAIMIYCYDTESQITACQISWVVLNIIHFTDFLFSCMPNFNQYYANFNQATRYYRPKPNIFGIDIGVSKKS